MSFENNHECRRPLKDEDLNADQLAAIEEMAANGFDIHDIAEVLQVNKHALKHLYDNPQGLVYGAYRKGFLQSQLELRQRIFKDVKHGSSPAQTLAKKILDDAEYKMNQL